MASAATTTVILIFLTFSLLKTTASSDSDCTGRRIHIRKLPTRFNLDLLTNCSSFFPLYPDFCPHLANHGLGPKTHNRSHSWYRTDTHLLELFFHRRLLEYPCLSPNPLQSDAIFLPYYSSLDSLHFLYGPDYNVSHLHGLDLFSYLQSNDPDIWGRNNGHDHFLIMARTSWDFSQPLPEKSGDENGEEIERLWGTSFLMLPEFFNLTVLTLESRAWPWQEQAIPHPTSFHPSSLGFLDSWILRVRKSRRSTLMFFAGGGGKSPTGNPNVRRSIREECGAVQNSSVFDGRRFQKLCEIVDCSNGICEHDPIRYMKPMLQASFCLQPPGETPSRRSTFDGILAGCIPVFFEDQSAKNQFQWHLPPAEYEEFSVTIPKEDVVFKGLKVVDVLMGIPRAEVRRMREKVMELIPKVMYRKHGSSLGLRAKKDAFDIAIEGTLQRDSDQEPTLEEMMVKGKTNLKSSSNKEAEVDAVLMFEDVKKDLNALSRDEQMDVVYSSAPELVGLLAELNDATKQLETHVNPLLSKVRKGENAKKEGLHYLEVKQLLLLAYCQAITFYLLLKSEGQPIRDHPVIARLVEIKNLLEKMKELDVHIPDNLEDVLVQTSHIASAQKPVVKGHELSSDLFAKLDELTGSSIEKQKPSKLREAAEPVQKQSVEVNEKRLRMIKDQEQPMSSESVQMLQYRAGLQKQLKQRADSVVPKTNNSKNMKLKKIPGKLETTDDYDDDVMALEGATHGSRRASTLSSKLSQIVPAKGNRLKDVSGDVDLPERDDLGERRWKHELRVLARAGIKSKDNDDAELDNEPESLGGKTGNGADAGDSDEDNNESEDFYNLVKKQKEAKLKLKAAKFSRNPQDQYELEITADGKRHISMQMEKNRGLTRDRKKQIKNPRKKYKLQHKKAVNSRKGQVREVKRSKLSYEGELTGINPRISRSRRLG